MICSPKVEHYEIAGYGCAKTYARLLGYDEVEDLLQETLDEEGNADKILTEIADELNPQALQPAVSEE
jgi:ferritin-like metal-binding protein YciE